MELDGVTFIGSPMEAPEMLADLPPELATLLRQINGFVLHHGMLHVRGAVLTPEWHSLETAWKGPAALHALYADITATDVPFAQDCVGDQFLLRDGRVVHLSAEDGALEYLNLDLFAFLESASNDPIGYLRAQPLIAYAHTGGRLEPGEVLLAYPPYCTRESAQGTSLKAVPALEAIGFHAEFARQIRQRPDGSSIRIVVE